MQGLSGAYGFSIIKPLQSINPGLFIHSTRTHKHINIQPPTRNSRRSGVTTERKTGVSLLLMVVAVLSRSLIRNSFEDSNHKQLMIKTLACHLTYTGNDDTLFRHVRKQSKTTVKQKTNSLFIFTSPPSINVLGNSHPLTQRKLMQRAPCCLKQEMTMHLFQITNEQRCAESIQKTMDGEAGSGAIMIRVRCWG